MVRVVAKVGGLSAACSGRVALARLDTGLRDQRDLPLRQLVRSALLLWLALSMNE